MLSRKEVKVQVVRDELEEITCDWCKKKIIENKKDEEEIAVAHLIFFKGTVEAAKKEELSEAAEQESSDLCGECYEKIKNFLTKLGAKIPSYYISDKVIDDAVMQAILSFEQDDDDDDDQEDE